jgi:hypothetical protein
LSASAPAAPAHDRKELSSDLPIVSSSKLQIRENLRNPRSSVSNRNPRSDRFDADRFSEVANERASHYFGIHVQLQLALPMR